MRCGIYRVSDAGPGGLAQRGLDDGRVLMDARKVVALFGVVVASTAVGPGKVNALISLEIGTAEDGACAYGAR